MNGPYIAGVAALVGDPGRANMLLSLMGGQALTAKELALVAGVSSPTASGHLSRLVDGELVTAVTQGRHRYFRLASPRIAAMLEVLMQTAADAAPRHRPRSMRDDTLAEARTCYNHLAGRVAVEIAHGMCRRGLIELSEEAGRITRSGEEALLGFGVRPPSARGSAIFCKPCLDWSERRLHIGGALGAQLLVRLKELGWIADRPGSRAVTVTVEGRAGIKRLFG